MAVDILKQFEGVPDAYPYPPNGLSYDAQGIDYDAIWQRIESYIAYRWSPREVVWTLRAPAGAEWSAPLTPIVSFEAHIWTDQWEAVTLLEGPVGLCLPSDGSYRITAQVGAGPVPPAAQEAYRRLAEYSSDIADFGARKGEAGATRTVFDVGDLNFQNERWATWAARAIDLSGAADLLRPYRRA